MKINVNTQKLHTVKNNQINKLIIIMNYYYCHRMQVSGCSSDSFRSMSMEEIMYKADIVVYGAQRTQLAGLEEDTTDAMFEVFCVLKNSVANVQVPEMVRILQIKPITSCTGTEYDMDEHILLALTTENGHFKWHEVNVTPDNMAFPVSGATMSRALTVCGLDDPQLPTGRNVTASPKCPLKSEIEVTPDTCTDTASHSVHQTLVVVAITIASLILV